jgi:F0F1-type ATP synthase membrane subunit b/b'
MNNLRRKALMEIEDKIGELKSELETIRDEEQEYIDNMPESLQSSEKHEAGEVAVENMENIIDSLSEAITYMDAGL